MPTAPAAVPLRPRCIPDRCERFKERLVRKARDALFRLPVAGPLVGGVRNLGRLRVGSARTHGRCSTQGCEECDDVLAVFLVSQPRKHHPDARHVFSRRFQVGQQLIRRPDDLAAFHRGRVWEIRNAGSTAADDRIERRADQVLPSFLAVTGSAVLSEELGSARGITPRVGQSAQHRDWNEKNRTQPGDLSHRTLPSLSGHPRNGNSLLLPEVIKGLHCRGDGLA